MLKKFSFLIVFSLITLLIASCTTLETDELSIPEILYEKTAYNGVYRMVANPKRGYNFNAYFYVPYGINTDYNRLVVQMINNGANKTQEEYDKEALNLCRKNNFSHELKLPFVTFACPRITEAYTHALSSACMTATGNIKRVDEQLIHVIDDVLEIISKDFGIELEKDVILIGYSAGGMFTSHFSLLHPERVHIAIAGGNQAAFSLPFDSYNGYKLNFPLGTANYQKLTNHLFDLEEWKSIHFLLVNGEFDDNDSVNPSDCHPGNEPRIIKSVLGNTMLERTQNSSKLYKEYGAQVQFLLYQNSGHRWHIDDVIDFIKVNCGTDFNTIKSNHPIVNF